MEEEEEEEEEELTGVSNWLSPRSIYTFLTSRTDHDPTFLQQNQQRAMRQEQMDLRMKHPETRPLAPPSTSHASTMRTADGRDAHGELAMRTPPTWPDGAG